MEQMIIGNESALKAPKTAIAMQGKLDPIRTVLHLSRRRKWHHLAEERIEDVRPQIPLGRRFWTLTDQERGAIKKLFEEKDVTNQITGLKGRKDSAKVRVIDAAYWVKGCSSLGRLRYAVLAGIGPEKNRSYCLVDLKEAVASSAPSIERFAGTDAERVVQGACALSPNLGERMAAVRLLRKDIVMRELMPQDLKFDLDLLTRDEAVDIARFLAGVVGKAHGRQMNRKMRSKWLATLGSRHPKDLNAPVGCGSA